MGFVRFLCGLCLLLHLFDGSFRSSVLADQIFANSGGRFGRSSREPKYKVEFHPEHSPFHPKDGQEAVVMSNKEGRNYNCFLPLIEETKHLRVTQENSSSIITESERKIVFKTPDELIEILNDKCFYRHEGWWTYEFCFRKHVKQLHVEDEKVVQEFILGMFDPDATADFNQNQSDFSIVKDPRSKDASQRYHAHQFTNGTICDLTNQPRETEVRFVCSEPSVLISSIKEASTCKYVVTVQCPLLCKHPMFQQEQPMWHTIHCNEVGADSKISTVEDGLKGTHITIIADDSA
ncbi:protein OS-9 homolog [Musa acuminata AAA Group]|uniref:protein OS-9 homolog n=1 Tax=Musa acuminata AAA Group TaxID=214697 RepID=UPI0031D7047E